MNSGDSDTTLLVPPGAKPNAPRGKLKIFLGYAAGVGKTYAMLEAAQQRRHEGVDVIVAVVNADQQPDTHAFLAQLSTLPTLPDHELNLDAVLARQPQLAVIDELAHHNAPGLRHNWRYQDVEELLAAGIDVYTSLNIQHLESLKDVVAQITGIVIQDSVPDRVLNWADQVELIDLPPEELIKRWQEGKARVPHWSSGMMKQFFREGNLTALRELALRWTARRVDAQMNAYMQKRSIRGPWAATERLMVCASSSPLTQRLIRTASRLSHELDAVWHVVYIETPAHARLRDEQQRMVIENLQLAEKLGAEVVTLPASSVADALSSYAVQHNITKMIIGKPLKPRWLEILRGSVVDQLIRQSHNIDVYVISSAAPQQTISPVKRLWELWTIERYLPPPVLVGITTLLGQVIATFISPVNLEMIYLLAVLIAAIRFGRGAAILTAFLSVAAFNFFFIPPRLTFAVEDAEYLLTFAGLLITGLVTATLASRMREHADAAERRENYTTALYALSRDLSASVNLEVILQAVLTHVSRTFQTETALLLPENGAFKANLMTDGFPLNESELAAAQWAFEHEQNSGQGTDNFSTMQGRYLPLRAAEDTVGVLGVQLAPLSAERERLLMAFSTQAALGIEAVLLAKQAQQTQLLREKEKLQTALLNSVSHDLRTPLVSITGALSSLRDQADYLDEQDRSELVEGALEEANRLNHLVGNLLDMSRLEAHAVSLRRVPLEVQEVVGVALAHTRERLRQHEVKVELPPDLPLVSADFVLIVQVLVNLLDNAAKYAPSGSQVEICAATAGKDVEITVLSQGTGVPPADLERIFEKFYRSDNIAYRAVGTGLGLSICKGIVEAHQGQIRAENREGGGMKFTFTLPVDPSPV